MRAGRRGSKWIHRGLPEEGKGPGRTYVVVGRDTRANLQSIGAINRSGSLSLLWCARMARGWPDGQQACVR